MGKLVTTEQMRSLEQAAIDAGTPERELMRRAGMAVGKAAHERLAGEPDASCLVLVGPGNNGGDGLVAARYLHDSGTPVQVYLLRSRPDSDSEWTAVRDAGIPWTVADGDPDLRHLNALLRQPCVVVDAIFGIGFHPSQRPIEGIARDILGRLRAAQESDESPYVIAADVPSGVDSDTGAVDPVAVHADATVTFQCAKVGIVTGAGRALAGCVEVASIGVPQAAIDALPFEELVLDLVRPLIPQRPADSNKGTFGRAVIAGGSQRYPGAIRLAAESAARSGCGLVTLAAPEAIQPLLVGLPDPTHEPLPCAPDARPGYLDAHSARCLLRALRTSNARSLLVGPGMDLTGETRAFVQHLLAGLDSVEGLRAVIFDADALNVLADEPDWHSRISVPRVLTPHPGEMSRLMRCTVAEVQAHRLTAALEYARRTDSVVVLKGAGTIVAAPDGRARISGVANSALAHGGTGDVLAGLIAGFAAQGLVPFDAASAAVWTHGACANQLSEEQGATATLASDLVRVLPQIRNLLEPPTEGSAVMSS